MGIPTCIASVPGSPQIWGCSYESSTDLTYLYIIDGDTDQIIWQRTIDGYAQDIIADVDGHYVAVMMTGRNDQER